MLDTPQGTTLRDLAQSKGWTTIKTAEWLCGEIRAKRVKRYWRVDYAIYRTNTIQPTRTSNLWPVKAEQ